jgi:hypothetical protein
MRTRWAMVGCILAGLGCGVLPGQAAGQSLLAENAISDVAFDAGRTDAPDAKQYAEGAKAIHEGRWTDAVKIFEAVEQQKSEHAVGAAYWKAYALNKMGQPGKAIETCTSLKAQNAKSTWVDDCGALEIEIRASSGQTVSPKADQSDELKLLSLATLMRSDPQAATDQIKEIVQGDGSEKLKEGAVFILGQQVPDATYPQIVRISYLEGDVRVARAAENEKSNKPAWESAVMNLPLSEGDSVVTGKDGRAEIEFEDASTLYLGENSVLNCIDMHTTGGVPHTELALVSGTLNTHLNSLMGGETFLIRTPTENMLTRYPEKSNLRITSYLDGMALTSLTGGALNVTGANKMELTPGKTMFFSEGHHVISAEEAGETEDFAAFDAWVADRYGARTSAATEVMKEAGLAKPVPGLAEMKGKGHFFECPPYGMCWEPDAPQAKAVLTAPPTPAPTPKSARASAGGPTNGGMNQSSLDWFPCMSAWYPGMGWGAYGRTMPVGYASIDPFAWAVCHSGDWLPYNGRYAWVAGARRHHHCPVRWVKFGRTTVAVPLHPKDVKGKPPINRAGFEPIKGKDGLRLAPIRLEAGRPIQVVKSPPKDFRNVPRPVLLRADAPRMVAVALHDNMKAGIAAHRAIPMSFNHQQGFVTSHQVMQGGHPVAVSVPVGRVGGGGFPSGFSGGGMPSHGGSAGFGAISVSRAGGGSFNGGGGHVGGGSVSGGGGSVHGGGGSVSTSSVSSSSASSTAAPSSSPHR